MWQIKKIIVIKILRGKSCSLAFFPLHIGSYFLLKFINALQEAQLVTPFSPLFSHYLPLSCGSSLLPSPIPASLQRINPKSCSATGNTRLASLLSNGILVPSRGRCIHSLYMNSMRKRREVVKGKRGGEEGTRGGT